jgi:hypothetical protein
LRFSSPIYGGAAASAVFSVSLLSILIAPLLTAPLPIAGFTYRHLGLRSDLAAPFRRVAKLVFPLLGAFIIWTVYMGFGLLLFAFPAFLVYIRYSLTPHVVVIEGEGGYGAIKRSKVVMEGEFSRGMITLLLPMMTEILIALIISTPLLMLMSGRSFGAGWEYLIFGLIVPLLFDPIRAIVSTLLYLDLRSEKEGLDDEILRMEFMELEE